MKKKKKLRRIESIFSNSLYFRVTWKNHGMCVNCSECYCAHTHKPTEIKSAKFAVLNFDANKHALHIGATSYDEQHITAEINANTNAFCSDEQTNGKCFFFRGQTLQSFSIVIA